MKRLAIIGLLGLVLSFFLGAEIQAQVPKEGSGSYVAAFSTTFKAIPMGKERVHMTYEGLGVTIGDNNQGLLHNASAHCIGSVHAIKGEFDNDFGFCVYTLPDGDQVFQTYKASGKVGEVAKGTGTFVGGTGKLVGIQGTTEFTRQGVRPALPGTAQGYTRSKGSYKLP